MPAYTFRCRECGLVFDRRLHFHERLEDVTCPRGHTAVVRVFRPPAVVFKGSGFYVTDSRKASSSTAGHTAGGEGKGNAEKTAAASAAAA